MEEYQGVTVHWDGVSEQKGLREGRARQRRGRTCFPARRDLPAAPSERCYAAALFTAFRSAIHWKTPS